MNNNFPDYNISFEQLIDIFTQVGTNHFELQPEIGKGAVHIFNLEDGLKARFWNCECHRSLQIHNHSNYNNTYYNLAFFSESAGIQLRNGHTVFRQVPEWDAILISSSTLFNIHVNPDARVKCLGISFSREWITDNFLNTRQSFLSFEA